MLKKPTVRNPVTLMPTDSSRSNVVNKNFPPLQRRWYNFFIQITVPLVGKPEPGDVNSMIEERERFAAGNQGKAGPAIF